MKVTQIKETCLYVKDIDRTEVFYHGVLGFALISKDPGNYVFFRAGSSVLLCFIAAATRNQEEIPPHYGEGKLHLAFEVKQKDYAATKKEIEEKGITITHEHEWKKGKSFYFEDPDGHVLEIVSEGLWS